MVELFSNFQNQLQSQNKIKNKYKKEGNMFGWRDRMNAWNKFVTKRHSIDTKNYNH